MAPVGTSDIVVHVPLAGPCHCPSKATTSPRSPTPPTRSTPPTDALSVHLAGELHARGELAARCGVSPAVADTVLLAAAWARFGASTPLHVHGEYAAVIVEHGAGRVTLVRDHIGTHALRWHTDGRCVHAATSTAALLAFLPSRPAPDEDGIAGFLLDPSRAGATTLLRGVSSVEPGHLVVVEAGRSRAVRWWRPEELVQDPDGRRDELREDVRALVLTAVADRLPAAAAVGVHLSGGLDSTLVTLLAAELLAGQGRPLRHAYAWSPPVSGRDPDLGAHDERPRLARLAGEAGVALTLSVIDAADQVAFLQRPIELEGFADVSDELATLTAAARDGVGVLLSGWGGDELVSAHAPGMPAHLARRGHPRAALGALRRLNGGLRPVGGLVGHGWRQLVLPLLPDPLYRLAPSYGDVYGAGCYLGAGLAAQARAARASRPRTLALRVTSDPRADLLRLLRHGHVGERMATWKAWGAPFGVVHRYPLTDRRLMERVLTAPTRLLWGDGRPRYPARVAVGARTAAVMSKGDPANERQRLRMFRATWRQLGEQVAAGRFDVACDWVDMEALRADLARGPSGDMRADVLSVARMSPAVRIVEMWRRGG